MKKLLIITVILILGAAVYAYMEFNREVESNADAQADVAISANELLTAFQTNETEANTKYNDKVVEVTGAVREASQADGKTTVSLDAGDSMAGVTCEMDPANKRTDYKTGDQVTFKCTCTGMLMDVVLVRCMEK